MEITCEWGMLGLLGARAAGATIVIVDVLSFSTAVDVAVERGAVIHPYSGRHVGLRKFAESIGAMAARRRGEGGYSLSPTSYFDVPAGTHVALRSVNGGALSESAASELTYTGCLRNASALAGALACAGRVALIPAGERWDDGTLRPCIEDWLGAGAIAGRLSGERSAEAELAARSFESARPDVRDLLVGSRSGRELVEAGFELDVEIAADVDASGAVPLLRDGAYASARPPRR